MEGILRTLNERLEALPDRTEEVVLTWKGEARNAFIDELDAWDRAMRDMQNVQAWLQHMVTSGHANYSAAHRAVLRGWGGA